MDGLATCARMQIGCVATMALFGVLCKKYGFDRAVIKSVMHTLIVIFSVLFFFMLDSWFSLSVLWIISTSIPPTNASSMPKTFTFTLKMVWQLACGRSKE